MSVPQSDMAAFRAFVATKPKLILGSNSASRRAILDEMCREHGFSYKVTPANIDEKQIRRDEPADLVLMLGFEKAKAILARESATWTDPNTYLLTSDQVVVHDGRILEKAESEAEIRQNVRAFAETPAQTVGSLVCTHVASGKQEHKVDVATIHMELLPDSAVDKLIAEGDVFHSAGGDTLTFRKETAHGVGGLLAEHPLVSPHVTRIDGGLDAIMGLSKATVIALLVEAWKKYELGEATN